MLIHVVQVKSLDLSLILLYFKAMSSYVRFGNTAHINDNDDDEQQRSRVESIAGCTLSFHDIHYTVQIKTGSCKKGNQFEEKTILNGVR